MYLSIHPSIYLSIHPISSIGYQTQAAADLLRSPLSMASSSSRPTPARRPLYATTAAVCLHPTMTHPLAYGWVDGDMVSIIDDMVSIINDIKGYGQHHRWHHQWTCRPTGQSSTSCALHRSLAAAHRTHHPHHQPEEDRCTC